MFDVNAEINTILENRDNICATLIKGLVERGGEGATKAFLIAALKHDSAPVDKINVLQHAAAAHIENILKDEATLKEVKDAAAQFKNSNGWDRSGEVAAILGFTDIVFNNNTDLHDMAMRAAEHGRLDIMNACFAKDINPELQWIITKRVADKAVKYGHLECLKSCISRDQKLDLQNIAEFGVKYGRLDAIKYLVKNYGDQLNLAKLKYRAGDFHNVNLQDGVHKDGDRVKKIVAYIDAWQNRRLFERITLCTAVATVLATTAVAVFLTTNAAIITGAIMAAITIGSAVKYKLSDSALKTAETYTENSGPLQAK